MPHHPEDDWTRPMPRTQRSGRDAAGARRRDDWRERDELEETRPIPRQERPGRDERYVGRYDDSDAPGYEDQGYDEPGHREPGLREPRPRTAPPRRPSRRRRRYGFRRLLALVLLLLVGYVVSLAVVAALIWGSVTTIDATPDVADRPGGGAGENYLLVGTDSREQLSDEERSEFGTGATEGSRADTVMLLHVPTLGEPTLVSLPRDSYVEIRDHGLDKLNAAYSIGGAELLVDTVEQSTGLRLSGYLEIGFGGFVGVVDEVGGVTMCLDAPVVDERAHIDLPAGCQELAGPEALGYVRMRYSDMRGDIGRVERQREFLAALVQEMASPATVLNPFRLHQVGTATGRALAVGEDTSPVEAARMGLAMRSIANGAGISITVPVADPDHPTGVGSTVLWDEQRAAELFEALRTGGTVSVQP
ncbi:LCP family protein [Ornithinimicrobium cerasi]|uniref:Transcriptional attenuator, LytR family n=1 Tax=Ornithinimicrobium cerasi TaxID=2248773 RepID=A0A285VEF5_9MICO|nr:LCP family protein [Ornithinimicrobium cerasi]SOC52495.1 transcriptional attenuator, LytR family [Ornithinimicrobium cerasi]